MRKNNNNYNYNHNRVLVAAGWVEIKRFQQPASTYSGAEEKEALRINAVDTKGCNADE